MWRTDRVGLGTKLSPVAVSALLVERSGKPVLVIEDDDGNPFVYSSADARVGGFGSVIVLRQPTDEQVRLLIAAVEAGYPIEPRLAGRALLDLEHL